MISTWIYVLTFLFSFINHVIDLNSSKTPYKN